MVILCTNRPEYRNDVAEEIRLFLGLSEIGLQSEDTSSVGGDAFTANLTRNGESCLAYAETRGQTETRAFFVPSDATPLLRKKLEKRNLKLACFAVLRRAYPDVQTPWGSLTGIRPTKLFRELTTEGGEAFAHETFLHTFDVSEEKCDLAASICRVQAPILASIQPTDIDVYVGIPFCKTKCLYCSFPSEILGRDESRLGAYLIALKDDVSHGAALASALHLTPRAFYMGGGTPTVLSAEQLFDLLTHIKGAYGDFSEITVEAGRPDTITREKLVVLKECGVSRISINPQTMNDETLRRVGRTHTADETEACFLLSRELGFTQINMDLIAGLTGESLSDFQRTCERIKRLRPDNLTVHALAIKRSARLKNELTQNPLSSQDDVAQMIKLGAHTATDMGMRPYYMYRQKYMSGNLENVGYARPGSNCIYNIDMMEESVSILAHGAGTMTKRVFGAESRIERLPSPKDVPTYLQKLEQLKFARERFFSD